MPVWIYPINPVAKPWQTQRDKWIGGEKHPKTAEQLDTMRIIENHLREIEEDGFAECRICGEIFYGKVGDILQRLGEHSDSHERI